MVLGRLRETVSDAAETIRRAFQDAPSRGVSLALDARSASAELAVAVTSAAPLPDLMARPGPEALLSPPKVLSTATAWTARLQQEAAWERWAAGARVTASPVFHPERTARLEIPALPRKAAVRSAAAEPFRCAARRTFSPLRVPGTRGPGLAVSAVRVVRDLDLAMGLPVALPGQDPRSLPKGLWMRYTIQLVKETGENIRNLDVLGIYWLPHAGVTEMRHDAATGRLRVRLTREACHARRGPFLLARRKEDRTLVSCFLEPG